MPKLHIILTCDGGNGNKSAAEAVQNRAIADGDAYEIINTCHNDWFSNQLFNLGARPTQLWDWAQRNSQTELLRLFASTRDFSGLVFNTSFANKSYALFQNRDDINTYSEVIFHNTQPNNLKNLISSVARYNRECKAHNLADPETPRNLVKYVNHFADLPTSQAVMFRKEMSRINVADLNDAQFELHTRPPILNKSPDSPNDEHLTSRYHQKIKQLYPKLYLDLPPNKNRVKFVDGPIRAAFLNRKNNPALRADGLNITFSNETEFCMIRDTLVDKFTDFNSDQSNATISIEENAEVVSIMLGSQASIDGTHSLVQKELECPADALKTKYVFVFCGANQPQNGLILYGQIVDIAKNANANPDSRIKIIPLTNQPAEMIADIYSLADRVITRPGGISIMEIEAAVKTGQIFLFTELGKLSKLFHAMTFRSKASLEEQYGKQASASRFNDLIAWEQGNGLHAQNTCKDAHGRTRVTPINTHTFGNELAFIHKKRTFMTLIENQDYLKAFDELNASPKLNAFMLTGNDVAADLARLVDIIQLCDKANQTFSELTQQHNTLATLNDGPADTFRLISKLRQTLLSKLKPNPRDVGSTGPSDILKDALSQLADLQYALKNNIDTVKNSSIENKPFIIKALESVYRAVANFFRSIFGFKPVHNASTVLEHVRNDIIKTITPPNNVDEWLTVDEIIAEIIQNDPTQKKRTFIISKEKYPDLSHDVIYCGASMTNTVNTYRIGKELSKTDAAIRIFLQARNGEPVVMTQHLSSNTPSKELECLDKMGRLIDHCKYSHEDKGGSSDYLSIQTYIPGKTLSDYIAQNNTTIFAQIRALSEERKIQLALALAKGLKQITVRGITHGNINLNNILIQEDANRDITATFTGFELSQSEKNPSLREKPLFSQKYLAPELLAALQRHEDGTLQVYPYSEKSDVYSLGMVLKDLGINSLIAAKLTHDNPEERADITEVIALLSQDNLEETPTPVCRAV